MIGHFFGNNASISIARANRAFEFNKRTQLFIRTDNEMLSVAAVRVGNPDCSPVAVHG
jgi:hypothetical protein